MKVIKKGNSQKGWAHKYICSGYGNKGGGCGAKLLVEWDDLFITRSCAIDGFTDCNVTFQCCECGMLTDIPINDPPDFTLIPDKDVWTSRQLYRKNSLYGGLCEP